MKKALSFIFLLLFFIFSVTSVYSQNPEWIQYTHCQNITALVEEGNYIWVGSHTGVYKIDKATEKTICYNNANSELPCNDVSTIAVDSSGNKWIGGSNIYGGWVAKFDGTSWTNYNASNSPLYVGVTSIAIESNGIIWIGVKDTYGEGGLVKFDGKNWTVYNPYNSECPAFTVNSIDIDSNSAKWIGTTPPQQGLPGTGGVAKFDDVNWTVYHIGNSDLPDNDVQSIAIDEKDRKWMIHEPVLDQCNFTMFDNTNWITYDTLNSGLNFNEVSSIEANRDGNIWIGVELVNELVKYDGTNWTIFRPPSLMGARSILIDNKGNPWVGTLDIGLVKLDSTYWRICNISNSGLPDYSVTSITIDAEGNKWIGTDGGLAKFDGTNWTVYDKINSDLPYNPITSIAIDKNGNKWIGTNDFIYGGLAKFDGTNWTIYNKDNSGLPYDAITSIAIDKNGDKWIGTCLRPRQGALVKYDGTNWTTYTTSDGLPYHNITSIVIDSNGNKWIGTGDLELVGNGGGLAKYDGTNWTTYTTSDGLPHENVTSIAIDSNGNMWVGTGVGGLGMFDGNSWTVYDTSNSGLPRNDVASIIIDGSNNKWIGTRRGLAKFDGTDWTVYDDYNSGLPDNYVRSLAIDSKGNKWIGTGSRLIGGGLAVFNEGGIVSVKENNPTTQRGPLTICLQQNYSFTKVSYLITNPSHVIIKIFNIKGRLINTLVNTYKHSGYHTINWNINNVGSGTYYLKLTTESNTLIKKAVIIH